MSFSLSGLNTVLFALAPGPHRTQQFQKNAYHNDKCVISEPVQKPSTGPTIQGLHFCGGNVGHDLSARSRKSPARMETRCTAACLS
jgi:hypothetical protein